MFGFLLRFLLLYLLLMIPWPGVESTYRSVFVHAGAFLYSGLGEHYDVRGEERGKNGILGDVVFVVPRKDMDRLLEPRISSREVGYLATSVTIALILATPATWRRRLRTVAVGSALTCVFVAVRPLFLVLYLATVDAQILTGAVQPTALDKAISAGAKFVAFGQPMSYIVPVIIWILVAVRRDVIECLVPDFHRVSGS